MMYESRAMKEMASQLASPATNRWKFGQPVGYDCSGMDASRHRIGAFTQAKADLNVSSTCTNYTYIIRNILLKNINEHACIYKSCAGTDNVILRPIALLDVAMRDLQECKDWPMSEVERRRYDRTMEDMHKIWNRFYKHMGQEQIYLLNEAMSKMEEGITHDYDVLKFQIVDAMRDCFSSRSNLMYCASLCVMHVCVDLPMKYIKEQFNSRIKELEQVSTNICLFMRYYASTDEGTEADIDLNKDTNVSNAMRVFQNRFYGMQLV